MDEPGYEALRDRIASGAARIEVLPLTSDFLASITWSGSQAHLDDVALQLARVPTGEVEYVVLLADGHPVCKGGVDFVKAPGAGTIWQLATHPRLEGLGLATRLVHELEVRVAERGIGEVRLGVEPENERARRLYEHLGYRTIGESEASWEVQRSDGSRSIHTTKLIEMSRRA